MSDSNSTADADRIPYARQSIDDSDIEAVVQALRSDFVTQGPRIAYFEDGLTEVTGARYAIAVSSGTAALHLACQGLGLKEGDIGVSPAITFAATANAIAYTGATVAFSDVDPKSGLSFKEHFQAAVEALGERQRAAKLFIPVSFAGRPPGLKSICEYAESIGATVVEDAAHSLGAGDANSKSASCAFTAAATLSFHPVKHICAGEGGAVLTNDAVLARRLKALRSHGVERPVPLRESEGPWAYAQTELGWNYRMTDIQASLGKSQLARLDTFVARRRAIARRYVESFESSPFRECFESPEWDAASSWHLFCVRFKTRELRRLAYERLAERGISTQVHYRPVYRHPYYASQSEMALSGAERFYEGCLSLPLFPDLREDQQTRVIEEIKRFCGAQLE